MLELLLSVLTYAGIAIFLLGGIGLLVPIRRLGIPTRRRALRILLAGATLLLIALLAPAPESRAAARTSRLDELHERWQFSEFHQTLVAAPPHLVYRAIKETTAGEIAFFQTLTAIRRFGKSGPESILNAPDDTPILDVATRTGFRLLADEPDVEVAFGAAAGDPSRSPRTLEEYAAVDQAPGFIKITMNFRVTPEQTGTRLTTETRVYTTDAASRRLFAVYWRIIYPGSSLIRYMWLRAIRLRAESAATPGPMR
jgi:hypothetical protein